MKKIAVAVSSGLGIGFIPWASGTFGTLWGVLLFYLLGGLSWQVFFLITLGAILIAVFLAHQAEIALGQKDSSVIVSDEIVGYLVTVIGIPFGPVTAIAAFILFRLFDIFKPFPIRRLEKRLPGGWGVVLDDVMAGVYAQIVLRLFLYFWQFR